MLEVLCALGTQDLPKREKASPDRAAPWQAQAASLSRSPSISSGTEINSPRISPLIFHAVS